MDYISTLINILPDPYGAIVVSFFALLGALVSFASVIVPLTKTPKDDEALAFVKSLLGRFSVLEPKK